MDGGEKFTQCPRERVRIIPTRFGRLGMCLECVLHFKEHDAKPKKGKEVELEGGAKGREMPKTMFYQRRGMVVTHELPPDAGAEEAAS